MTFTGYREYCSEDLSSITHTYLHPAGIYTVGSDARCPAGLLGMAAQLCSRGGPESRKEVLCGNDAYADDDFDHDYLLLHTRATSALLGFDFYLRRDILPSEAISYCIGLKFQMVSECPLGARLGRW
jgi:hypothetical protein